MWLFDFLKKKDDENTDFQFDIRIFSFVFLYKNALSENNFSYKSTTWIFDEENLKKIYKSILKQLKNDNSKFSESDKIIIKEILSDPEKLWASWLQICYELYRYFIILKEDKNFYIPQEYNAVFSDRASNAFISQAAARQKQIDFQKCYCIYSEIKKILDQ